MIKFELTKSNEFLKVTTTYVHTDTHTQKKGEIEYYEIESIKMTYLSFIQYRKKKEEEGNVKGRCKKKNHETFSYQIRETE